MPQIFRTQSTRPSPNLAVYRLLPSVYRSLSDSIHWRYQIQICFFFKVQIIYLIFGLGLNRQKVSRIVCLRFLFYTQQWRSPVGMSTPFSFSVIGRGFPSFQTSFDIALSLFSLQRFQNPTQQAFFHSLTSRSSPLRTMRWSLSRLEYDHPLLTHPARAAAAHISSARCIASTNHQSMFFLRGFSLRIFA